MDSFDPQTTNSTTSATDDTADNSSIKTPPKLDLFLSTYNRRQRFTLPESLMHYIAKNPKNAKVYQKMIKRCKYFFFKNPILVVDYLYYNQNEWQIWIDWKTFDLNKILTKLWITNGIRVHSDNKIEETVASSVIPKIYRCDVKNLTFYDQVISYYEFIFLCSYVEDLTLIRVNVKNDDGTEVACEKLIEQLPKLKKIEYSFENPSKNTSKNTFKEIWKIPHLSNYDYFILHNIPANFDIESFYSFMKKNQNTHIALEFSDEISEEYKARLEAIVDEIIGTKNHEYKPPYIDFPGLTEEKIDELWCLYIKL